MCINHSKYPRIELPFVCNFSFHIKKFVCRYHYYTPFQYAMVHCDVQLRFRDMYMDKVNF